MSDLFISYHSADPLAHSFQIQLHEWAKKYWEFPTVSFHEQEPPVSFQSHNASGIRRRLRKEIKQAHQLLIVISRGTWQSEWADWEIAIAKQEDKQLLAAKLDSANISPLGLVDAEPIWIDPFDPVVLSQRKF
ncbi:TIR domain-containing protein [Levilactobacillus cerevisiae]|uniref:TIR domain-containing protein n=1 Tax=Levilactobacillus cerevisiae TaxID=1704076 RepID=UPI000F7A2802|nr:TIR domain-containing protein [Levilactobacillus cerevisiae]